MAIYHFTTKRIQRSKGKSAIAKSAYIGATVQYDERTGESFDYTKRKDILYNEIMTPDNTKIESNELWQLAEHAEKRKDGSPGREYEFALPAELDADGRLELAKDFAKYMMQAEGCAVQLALHAPKKKGSNNFHAHLLCTTRVFKNGELKEKCNVELSNRDRKKKGLTKSDEALKILRKDFEKLTNAALEKHGFTELVSSETLEAQGLDRLPQVHLSGFDIESAARGIYTTNYKKNKDIKNENTRRTSDRTRDAARDNPTSIAKNIGPHDSAREQRSVQPITGNSEHAPETRETNQGTRNSETNTNAAPNDYENSGRISAGERRDSFLTTDERIRELLQAITQKAEKLSPLFAINNMIAKQKTTVHVAPVPSNIEQAQPEKQTPPAPMTKRERDAASAADYIKNLSTNADYQNRVAKKINESRQAAAHTATTEEEMTM